MWSGMHAWVSTRLCAMRRTKHMGSLHRARADARCMSVETKLYSHEDAEHTSRHTRVVQDGHVVRRWRRQSSNLLDMPASWERNKETKIYHQVTCFCRDQNMYTCTRRKAIAVWRVNVIWENLSKVHDFFILEMCGFAKDLFTESWRVHTNLL